MGTPAGTARMAETCKIEKRVKNLVTVLIKIF
jgi:hypothetical protein